MAKRAAVVAVIHHELPRALRITVSSLLRAGFVPIIVFDKIGSEVVRFIGDLKKEGVELVPLYGFTWLSSGDVGIGQARDAGMRHAVELGFNCIATPDSHVVALGSADSLCRDAEMGATQGYRIDAPFYGWPDRTVGIPWYGRMYSISLKYFVEVYDCRIKPWSYEPLMAFSASALKKLMDVQSGRIIVGRGFGAELPDVSISLARLGYRVGCTPVKYIHRASTDDVSFWRERWNDERQKKYWMESFGAYVCKHVPDVDGPYKDFPKALEPWQRAICENFRKYAKRDIREVYLEFILSKPNVKGDISSLLF